MARTSKRAAAKRPAKRRANPREPSPAKKLAGVAARFAAFRPAREVLKVVRAVPTCLVQLDHATRVGGLPVEYFTLIHGRSNEGKSVAALAMVRSFLERDHFVLYCDAERTTPQTWVRQLMGDLLEHPRFFATRPDSYEDFIGEVRNFTKSVADAIAEGEVPADTACLVVVDSLGKLTPKDYVKELLAEFKKEDEEEAKAGGRFGKKPKVTTGKNRLGMRLAQMHAAWLREIPPQIARANGAVLAIEREYMKADATQYERENDLDYVVAGGGAAFYEGGLVIRISRARFVEHGAGKDRVVYGERHEMRIRKTKVGGKDGRDTVCYFHTSNGKLTPFGFDRARDFVELGLRLGVLRRANNTVKFGARVVGVGEDQAVRKLTVDLALMEELEAALRARFDVPPIEVDEGAPVPHDPETGEVLEEAPSPDGDDDPDGLFASTGAS